MLLRFINAVSAGIWVTGQCRRYSHSVSVHSRHSKWQLWIPRRSSSLSSLYSSRSQVSNRWDSLLRRLPTDSTASKCSGSDARRGRVRSRHRGIMGTGNGRRMKINWYSYMPRQFKTHFGRFSGKNDCQRLRAFAIARWRIDWSQSYIFWEWSRPAPWCHFVFNFGITIFYGSP